MQYAFIQLKPSAFFTCTQVLSFSLFIMLYKVDKEFEDKILNCDHSD